MKPRSNVTDMQNDTQEETMQISKKSRTDMHRKLKIIWSSQ